MHEGSRGGQVVANLEPVPTLEQLHREAMGDRKSRVKETVGLY